MHAMVHSITACLMIDQEKNGKGAAKKVYSPEYMGWKHFSKCSSVLYQSR